MQEVIVYRNPVEAAFWHAMQSGDMLPVFAGILAFFLTLWGFITFFEKAKRRMGRGNVFYRYRLLSDYLPMGVSVAVGILVAYKLWL